MNLSDNPLHKKTAQMPRLFETLWTVSLAVFTLQLAFDMSEGFLRYIRLGLTAVIYLLLLIKIFLLDGRTKRELLTAGVMILCATVGAAVSRDRWIFRFFLMIFAARGISMQRITINYLIYMSAVLLANLLLSTLGIKEDVLTIRPGTDYYRHSFGFIHPNAFSSWFFLISCAAVMLFHGRKALPVYALLLAAALLCFRYTDSRAGIAVTILLLLMCSVTSLIGKQLTDWKWLRLLFVIMTVLVPAAMLLMTWLYTPDSRFLALVDKVLSCRLSYGRCGMDQLPLTLFGNRIIDLVMPDGLPYTVDSMYVYSLLFLGIVPTLLLMGMLIRGCLRLFDAAQPEALAVYAAMIIYSLMENVILFCLFLPVYAVCASFGSTEIKRRPL